MRDWAKKKVELEQEKEKKRKEKAEKRKRFLMERKHVFEDQEYQRQKEHVLEELDDAVAQGVTL